ncbi:signal peptide peptidase-domain-containing protein [Scleroderma yunnanense]
MGYDWGLVSSYCGLLGLATLSIFTGAFGALPDRTEKLASTPKSLLRPDNDEDEAEDIPNRLSSGDAWIFPILGSIALFTLYLLIKYIGKEWLNLLLAWYTSLIGVPCVWKCVASLSRMVVGNERWKKFDKVRIFILKGPREISSLSLRTPTLLLFPVCILPSILYIASDRKSILLTDILALALSHNALTIVKLDSFRTGCIFLSGLFLYDIYWVFGTKVMVEVATSLDVPIKLLWPKSLSFASERGATTMLGLGDVVIPGTFIALALRYDYARSKKATFTKPYFAVTLMSYIAGLMTTMAVMHVFDRAQPALLYLSPACILSFLVTAFIRGEFRDAWGWSDDPERKHQACPLEATSESPDSAPPIAQTVNCNDLPHLPNENMSEHSVGQDRECSLDEVGDTRRRKKKGGKGSLRREVS